MIAASAMEKFDVNADGVLSRSEAEPMFKDAFEALKEGGKLNAEFQWNAQVFSDGWR